MSHFDEVEVLSALLGELSKIVRELITSIGPAMSPAQRAELQALDARLGKLAQVAQTYSIPPSRLSKVQSALTGLLKVTAS